MAAECDAPFRLDPSRAAHPAGFGGTQLRVNSGSLVRRRLLRGNVDVQEILLLVGLALFDADGCGFELRCARFRVDGIDRKIVSRHLIVEVGGEKRETRSQPWIKADRRDDRTPAGTDS